MLTLVDFIFNVYYTYSGMKVQKLTIILSKICGETNCKLYQKYLQYKRRFIYYG